MGNSLDRLLEYNVHHGKDGRFASKSGGGSSSGGGAASLAGSALHAEMRSSIQIAGAKLQRQGGPDWETSQAVRDLTPEIPKIAKSLEDFSSKHKIEVQSISFHPRLVRFPDVPIGKEYHELSTGRFRAKGVDASGKKANLVHLDGKWRRA